MAKKKALPAGFTKFAKAPAGALPMLPGKMMGEKLMMSKMPPKKKGSR